jgi:hypothetical protein
VSRSSNSDRLASTVRSDSQMAAMRSRCESTVPARRCNRSWTQTAPALDLPRVDDRHLPAERFEGGAHAPRAGHRLITPRTRPLRAETLDEVAQAAGTARAASRPPLSSPIGHTSSRLRLIQSSVQWRGPPRPCSPVTSGASHRGTLLHGGPEQDRDVRRLSLACGAARGGAVAVLLTRFDGGRVGGARSRRRRSAQARGREARP